MYWIPFCVVVVLFGGALSIDTLRRMRKQRRERDALNAEWRRRVREELDG